MTPKVVVEHLNAVQRTIPEKEERSFLRLSLVIENTNITKDVQSFMLAHGVPCFFSISEIRWKCLVFRKEENTSSLICKEEISRSHYFIYVTCQQMLHCSKKIIYLRAFFQLVIAAKNGLSVAPNFYKLMMPWHQSCS